MESFGLLVGHLLGDYIFQTDWQALNKTNPHPGEDPHSQRSWITTADAPVSEETAKALSESRAWHEAYRKFWVGHLACTIHCVLYTFAVWLCSFWWMPWWGLVACFVAHWPIDRFRLAGAWMRNVSGQCAFATGPLAPWSIIVVDNVAHLLTLFVIGMIAQYRY